MKNIRVFHLKKRTKKQQQQFFEVKLSIFLNRRVFVMRGCRPQHILQYFTTILLIFFGNICKIDMRLTDGA